MVSKKGFTLDQHREAGIMMQQAYKNVTKLAVLFGNAYGKSKEPYLSLQQAVNDLMTAKDKADDIFSSETEPPAKSPYYGPIDKPGA